MTARLKQLNHWLSETIGSKDYQLEPASDDASFRRYFRLEHNNETFIVMDAPPEQENCVPFIDIAERLLAVNINVPRIIEKDLKQGFLLLSDLGDSQYLDALTEESVDDPYVNSLYQAAMQELVMMQQQADTKNLPAYDEKLLLQEMELFRDWLLQEHIGMDLTVETQSMLDDVFKLLVNEALSQPSVFVHRDYHSRNLMLNGTAGENPGVLDFQDAVEGPFTYDLVSLLKDCYIKWPAQQVRDWAKKYFEEIADEYPDIDVTQFMRWFDLMGVQRHLKASGIFARLYHRDGKTGYLADIPRTLSYIVDLHDEYPELQGLVDLIQGQIMAAIEGANKSCAP
ncbi:MAG: phosphotransferase [Gammaproteobacteria bacterium]|nr:phosphotransferase [Gammaproteobacteria bacterium]